MDEAYGEVDAIRIAHGNGHYRTTADAVEVDDDIGTLLTVLADAEERCADAEVEAQQARADERAKVLAEVDTVFTDLLASSFAPDALTEAHALVMARLRGGKSDV